MKKHQLFEFPAGTVRKTARTTVGFRLEEDKFAELSKRAAALDVSPHELARHYVLEVLLENEERMELRKAVNALGQHVQEARRDIALATEVLLSAAGTVDEKKARAWTKTNLNRE